MDFSGAVRPAPGRLTGGFAHSPWIASKSSPFSPKREQIAELRKIEEAAEQVPNAQNIADLAVVNLLLGKPKKSVLRLEQALRLAPDDPCILNDLAAAYLARASMTDAEDPFDEVRALEAAFKATRIEPGLAEAWFNTAVAAEAISAYWFALRAWVSFVGLEPSSSGWAEEARTRSRELKAPNEAELWLTARRRLERTAPSDDSSELVLLVRRFPQPVRLLVEDELLPRWATSLKRGDLAVAEERLGSLLRIAAEVARVTGDPTLEDSVSAIASATIEERALLADGHILYREGRRRQLEHDPETAEAVFREADRIFASVGTPFQVWSHLYLAICALDKGDAAGALQQVSSLLLRPDINRRSIAKARALWIRGMALFAGFEPEASLSDFLEALSLFDLTTSVEDSGAVHSLIAANLDYLGDSRGTWIHLKQALSATRKTVQTRRVYTAFDEAAFALAKRGETGATLVLRHELVCVARLSSNRDPTGLAHALLRRAEAYNRLGIVPRARTDLAAALTVSYEIKSVSSQERLQAEVKVVQGEVDANSAPDLARRGLQEALAYYLRHQHPGELPRIYLALARLDLAKGDWVKAAAWLSGGIEIYERVRARVLDESLRISHFDQADRLFDELIDLLATHGQGEAAWGYAERFRARALRDVQSLASESAAVTFQPISAIGLAGRIPRRTALIEYAVLDRHLLVWLFHQGHIRMLDLPVGERPLREKVARLRVFLEGKSTSSALDAELADIYDLILKPVLDKTVPGSELVIVPDKSLHLVPFAALIDRRTGRYLIEDREIAITLSASLYATRPMRNERPLSALAVGISEVDRHLYPTLRSLPWAVEEAHAVADLYGKGGRSLINDEATPELFLGEAGKYDVIHIASHTSVSNEFPLASSLLLAPKVGALSVAELSSLARFETRFVVLSGCQTGVGPSSASEGILSIARPFIAQGASAVVATLWDVRDRSMPKIIVRLHEAIQESSCASESLRTAQMEAIRGSDPLFRSPRTWGALQVLAQDPCPR